MQDVGKMFWMDEKPQTKPWTGVEDELLRELILDGKSVEAAARITGRSPLAIRKRASKLKLTLRRVQFT
jgi:hypothetical protein